MQVTVLYVGSSLLAPLKNAEREINREYKLDLSVVAYNFGSPLNQNEWSEVDQDLAASDVVFVIHVMDGENAARLVPALERYRKRHRAVIVINCMPELMRRTRMGSLDVGTFFGNDSTDKEKGRGDGETRGRGDGERKKSNRALRFLNAAGSWVSRQAGGRTSGNLSKRRHGHGQYLKLVDKLPSILRFVPTAGRLREVKNYLYIFCYFLQPTPRNIRSMILFALKHYVPDGRLRKQKIDIPAPEAMPSVGIYHPDAPKLFETSAAHQ